MRKLLPVALASVALLAACGDDSSEGMSASASASGEPERTGAERAPATSPTETAKPATHRPGPLLKLRDSQFGPVLFDARSRALYLFTRDPRKATRCYGACAEAWPPFYAKGPPRAGRGVDEDLLGTIRRRDGRRRQVTYNGQALYFYVDDPRGQVLCNDVVEFGGTWFAVTAEGETPA